MLHSSVSLAHASHPMGQKMFRSLSVDFGRENIHGMGMAKWVMSY